MAVVSSHILNSVDGSHAGGIPVRLSSLSGGKLLAQTETDGAGRLSLVVDLSNADRAERYELCFLVGQFWQEQPDYGDHLIEEIVLRFEMPDPVARYHMPLILSPHGYSTWKSVPELKGD